jgi:hypothetical protein
MNVIQETFIESEWEDELSARAARDKRVQQLQAQGYVCSCLTLYNVFDQQVLFLEATLAEPVAPAPEAGGGGETEPSRRPLPRVKRFAVPKRDYETR